MQYLCRLEFLRGRERQQWQVKSRPGLLVVSKAGNSSAKMGDAQDMGLFLAIFLRACSETCQPPSSTHQALSALPKHPQQLLLCPPAEDVDAPITAGHYEPIFHIVLSCDVQKGWHAWYLCLPLKKENSAEAGYCPTPWHVASQGTDARGTYF